MTPSKIFLDTNILLHQTFKEEKTAMKLAEIERYIRPLSYAEKIQLIQDIAEMLREVTDRALLHRLHKAAEASGHYDAGPLEAYETAEQLQNLTKKEAI